MPKKQAAGSDAIGRLVAFPWPCYPPLFFSSCAQARARAPDPRSTDPAGRGSRTLGAAGAGRSTRAARGCGVSTRGLDSIARGVVGAVGRICLGACGEVGWRVKAPGPPPTARGSSGRGVLIRLGLSRSESAGLRALWLVGPARALDVSRMTDRPPRGERLCSLRLGHSPAQHADNPAWCRFADLRSSRAARRPSSRSCALRSLSAGGAAAPRAPMGLGPVARAGPRPIIAICLWPVDAGPN